MREINLPNYKKEQSFIKKLLQPVITLLLVIPLTILNFILRQIARLAMKRIRGIWFILLILYMAMIFVLMILIHKTQIEMYQNINRIKTIEIQSPMSPKSEEEQIEVVRQEEKQVEKVVETEKGYDTSKAEAFLRNYRQGNSPLINHLDKFFEGDVRKGKLALAIAGNETAFGTVGKGHEYFNAWGYLCDYDTGDCGWRDWNYSIQRYLEVADPYLSMFDGTKESLMAIQYNEKTKTGYHPVGLEARLKWADNIMRFYNNL